MEIAVCLPLSEPQEARLRRSAGSATVRRCAPDDLGDASVVFGNPTPEAIAANRALRWLQLESVGFGEYLGLDWSRASGPAQVTNLAGFFADPVAETALAGILALKRGIDRLCALRSDGTWIGDPIRSELGLLGGSKTVLFGRGAINGRLAELLAPFRCTVTAFGRDFAEDRLDAALEQADVVVATVPHTAATAGLFGAARLARMKRSAIFCNLGRGSLVDEEALARALRSGALAGAVIDVTQAEPLPPDHAFWTTPNTILTQHSGGGTADETDRKIDCFLNNLVRFRDGAPLEGLVDFTRGY